VAINNPTSAAELKQKLRGGYCGSAICCVCAEGGSRAA
jgi:hypothetical protein